MSLKEILDSVRRWESERMPVCMALLFRAEGSSPRPPGARLAMNVRGEYAGYISLGCVEGDLRLHIEQVLAGGKARVVRYGIADPTGFGVGLSCGGQIDVCLWLHSPEDAGWQRVREHSFEQTAYLFTRVDVAGAGAMLFLDAGEKAAGSLRDGELDRKAGAWINELTEQRPTGLWTLGDAVVFGERIAPTPKVIVVGATPVAASLCRLASALGWNVVVVDPRREFANTHLFPGARRIIHQWPEEGLREAGADGNSYVAVLSHDPKLDLPALQAALRAECRYIGLLGGRKTQEQRRAALVGAGWPPERVAAIRGPIGLPLGGKTPEEIAISILSEMVQHRNAGQEKKL